MLKELIDQDLVRSDYLKEFLVSHNLLHLLWVQQFVHDEYYEGSKTLWKLASNERKTKNQGLSLAIAKLAYLETITYENLKDDDVVESLEKFETAEDLVELHAVLVEKFKDILSAEKFIDIDNQDALQQEIMKLFFSKIPKHHTIISKIVKSSLREITSGFKLTSTGMIDILTIMNEPVADFLEDALRLALGFKDADVSKFYSNLVWRRCWLSAE